MPTPPSHLPGVKAALERCSARISEAESKLAEGLTKAEKHYVYIAGQLRSKIECLADRLDRRESQVKTYVIAKSQDRNTADMPPGTEAALSMDTYAADINALRVQLSEAEAKFRAAGLEVVRERRNMEVDALGGLYLERRGLLKEVERLEAQVKPLNEAYDDAANAYLEAHGNILDAVRLDIEAGTNPDGPVSDRRRVAQEKADVAYRNLTRTREALESWWRGSAT